METYPIAVQRCGCVALPEALAEELGMTPGALLSAESDAERRSVTLTVVKRAPRDAATAPVACPLEP